MEYKGFSKDTEVAHDASRSARAVEYAATMRRAMSDSKYLLPEASLRLPFDDVLFEKSRALATKLAGPKLLYILNIGIGGSNLGAKALYDAASGTQDAHTPFAPKMLFADTSSPELLSDILELLLSEVSHKEEIIIIVASKSGTTTETIMNASVLVGTLEQKIGSLADRIVCITDSESPLWNAGKERGFHLLPIPKIVGGRYSVFSPVGIFPLLCAGADAKALLRGAEQVVHECVEGGATSAPYKLALDIFLSSKEGTPVFDLFLFHPELEAFGKWYRQLFAESIGKATTVLGAPTTHRIIPCVSIGSTDLHSVEQMYLADPKLAARILVRAHAPHWEHELLAEDAVFAPLVPGVSRRAPCEIMDATYEAVKRTYRMRGVSFGEIILPDLAPESQGALLQFLMCAVMHLGDLLHINAFDQPNVEDYKREMRRILGGEK